MNEPKPTNKPKRNKPFVETPIELPAGLPQTQNMPFHEVMRRIVRVTPQEIKLPKR
jgi:hypothetical protein